MGKVVIDRPKSAKKLSTNDYFRNSAQHMRDFEKDLAEIDIKHAKRNGMNTTAKLVKSTAVNITPQ